MAGGGAGGGADSELVPLSDGDAYGATTREESEGVKLEDFKRGIRVARRFDGRGLDLAFSALRVTPPAAGAAWRCVAAPPRVPREYSVVARGYSAEARRGDAADAARREAGPTIGRAGRTRRSGSSIGPFARKNN